jgi:hypothetical protein
MEQEDVSLSTADRTLAILGVIAGAVPFAISSSGGDPYEVNSEE